MRYRDFEQTSIPPGGRRRCDRDPAGQYASSRCPINEQAPADGGGLEIKDVRLAHMRHRELFSFLSDREVLGEPELWRKSRYVEVQAGEPYEGDDEEFMVTATDLLFYSLDVSLDRLSWWLVHTNGQPNAVNHAIAGVWLRPDALYFMDCRKTWLMSYDQLLDQEGYHLEAYRRLDWAETGWRSPSVDH